MDGDRRSTSGRLFGSCLRKLPSWRHAVHAVKPWRFHTTMPEMNGSAAIEIKLKVNGKPVRAMVEPRTLLVEFIRETLDLPGTHIGCDTSFCGACTILLNGRS